MRAANPAEAVTVVDDGNHTYLTAELMPILSAKSAIVPTDFNAMGYSVPAAIGAKLARPDVPVNCIVGDGGFRMTCMEIITATQYRLGVVYYVFCDGELSQIAQAQEIPYNRKPCTVLATVVIEGVARAVGALYLKIDTDAELAPQMAAANAAALTGQPVIVEVTIDYSKRTAFTEGVVKTNFQRFTLAQKARAEASNKTLLAQTRNWVLLDAALLTLESGKLHSAVAAQWRASMESLAKQLAKSKDVQSQQAASYIQRYLTDPTSIKLRALPPVPPGAPI